MARQPDSSKNTPIAAGLTDSDPARADLVSAINQMFAEFELVYHNQYHKAFNTAEREQYAKKLWYAHLQGYAASAVLEAARRATRESEYLPTVRGVLKYLESGVPAGLPDVQAAYREACTAPSPKALHDWSQPIVFHAGAACDWYVLASAPESVSFPKFERHYLAFCQRLLRGEQLAPPSANTGTPPIESRELTLAERQQALAQLRKNTGL